MAGNKNLPITRLPALSFIGCVPLFVFLMGCEAVQDVDPFPSYIEDDSCLPGNMRNMAGNPKFHVFPRGSGMHLLQVFYEPVLHFPVHRYQFFFCIQRKNEFHVHPSELFCDGPFDLIKSQ